MIRRLEDRMAVVTGAGRGIGRAVAARLAAEGAEVVGLDIDLTSHRDGTAEDTAISYRLLECDCASEASVDRALASVNRPIHILVNNAGVIRTPAALLDTPPAEWDAVLSTNLGSVYHVCRAVIPRLSEGGAIVNMGSIVGLVGVPAAAVYAASKAAIVGLTRSMARDHAPAIRVNCVCPGAIDTGMFADYVARAADPAAERRRIEGNIPLARLGTPEDVAAAVVFLASEDASWITGAVLVVDGGDTA